MTVPDPTVGLPQGASSTVELLAGPPPCVRKRFRGARARAQEEHGLAVWGPRLSILRAPRLLDRADDDDPLTCRIELLEGVRLDAIPQWRTRLDLAATLGRGLAELHALPAPDDPLPLEEACIRRLRGWLDRDAGALSPSLRRRIERAFTPSSLIGSVRAPCHRDVGPTNVLARGTALALVDWEHARADSVWTDVLRIWDGLPPEEDPFTAALITGMGLSLDRWEELVALGLVEAAGCIVWGEARGDETLVSRGRTLLDRLAP